MRTVAETLEARDWGSGRQVAVYAADLDGPDGSLLDPGAGHHGRNR